MSSSKQLVLVIAAFLGLSAQLNVSAYNVAQLKDEVMLIERYAKHCTPAGLSDWLKKTIDSTYLTTDHRIVTIAAIVNDCHLSGHQKNQQLFKLMQADHAKWKFYGDAAMGLFTGAYIVFAGHEFYKMALRRLANHDAQLLAQAREQATQILIANKK